VARRDDLLELDRPPWREPEIAIVDAPQAAADAIDRLTALADPAVALAVLVPRSSSMIDPDDHRTGEVVAIAVGTSSAGVLVFGRSAIGALVPWIRGLASAGTPYVVAHGAQALVGRISAWLGEDWAPARLGCTRVAAVLLAEGGRNHDPPGLRECVAKVLGFAVEEPRFVPGEDALALRRLGIAADVLLPLSAALVPKLRDRELARVFGLECKLVPAVVAMERAGMPVDAAGFERIAETWRHERATATEPDRIARLDKLISTYAHWPRDFVRADRILCRLHPLAADTGRFSCTDPNLQQVPSEHTAPGLRACFRPPADRVLVVADYAQIELRVAAQLAPCDALAAVFREDRDPHRATAATLAGKPEAEVTSHERKLAKAVNFGFLFGMGAERFRAYALSGYGLELDDAAARRAREAFFTTYPGIAAWHRRVGQLCRQGGPLVVRTALGRRRRFAAGKANVPTALNVPVQGTAAEGFKRAVVALHPVLRSLGGRGVLVVHDEYVAELPRAQAEAAREQIERTMREAMATVVPAVPIVVEAHVVDRWS
jgi:DNA polymerase I-like protein with 3'-5' exonuclease and polymerase domains